MTVSLEDLKPVVGRWYTASFNAPTQLLKIAARKGKFHVLLPLVSACDQPGKRDVTESISDIRMTKRGAKSVLTFTEKSALWERKEYTIEFGPERIRYWYKVFGHGSVGRAYFFRSWFSDPRTVETEMGMVPGYDQIFSPAVNFFDKVYHFPGDTSIITVGDEPMYWGQALVAAPYSFAFNHRADKLWVWAALGVRPGEHRFEEFTYNTNETKRIYGAGGFDCNFNGKFEIDGQWESPHMVIGSASDPYQGLEDYVAVLEKDYGIKLNRKRRFPKWWRTPIVCGWGEQMSLGYKHEGNLEGVNVDKYCTQAAHDEWLDILRKHDIRAGQLIIDAGWQADGTIGDMFPHEQRWPDLRGWIDQRRSEGLRTILWMCAWNRQGVPDSECITNAEGKAVNVDPTNPAYEKRLRAMIRRLVSSEEGCYNADGVKIDGEMGCPTGPGLKNCGNVWGLELQRAYMGIVYDELKKHKPDAWVGAFQANPYMAQFSDVVRTADLFSVKSSPEDTMIHRAKILSITQPGCPIDTDHAFLYDVRDNWIDIMQAQLRWGIPCLYHFKYVWHKRPFVRPYLEEMTDAHYAAVAKAFKSYWKKLEGTR